MSHRCGGILVESSLASVHWYSWTFSSTGLGGRSCVMCGDSRTDRSYYESSSLFCQNMMVLFVLFVSLCTTQTFDQHSVNMHISVCRVQEHCVLSNTTNPNVSSQSIVKIRSGSTARSLSHLWSEACWDKSQASSLSPDLPVCPHLLAGDCSLSGAKVKVIFPV